MPAPSGSSPLARGPPLMSTPHRVGRGLIPARAGTTLRQNLGCTPCWAHPRSRGDHLEMGITKTGGAGSSPLARGPLSAVEDDHGLKGLIPARAGTTYSCIRGRNGFWAHPRSRGDHAPSTISEAFALGSSPLARGPPGWAYARRHGGGLIPARAGTTNPARNLAERERAHPRSRGDHTPGDYSPGVHGGSSPLARGPRECVP